MSPAFAATLSFTRPWAMGGVMPYWHQRPRANWTFARRITDDTVGKKRRGAKTREEGRVTERKKHPEYLWWNGEQMRWDDATVHVTELGWSTVGAVFEGIRAYWNDETGELSVFRLPSISIVSSARCGWFVCGSITRWKP